MKVTASVMFQLRWRRGGVELEAFVPYSTFPASLAHMPIPTASGQFPKNFPLSESLWVSNFYSFLLSKLMFLPRSYLGFLFLVPLKSEYFFLAGSIDTKFIFQTQANPHVSIFRVSVS